MRGHEKLVDMRLSHRKPSSFVSITVGPERSWLAEHWHEWEGSGPHIVIGALDPIERLDLRCLLDLEVALDGDEAIADRVWRVFDACVRAGAARVIGGTHRCKGEGLEPVENRDSKGVLNWHE